jgi:hypothetical protein
MVPKHVFDLKAGGVESRSTSMMDICHMKMRDPNLAARASDKIGISARLGSRAQSCSAKRIGKKKPNLAAGLG